ncbi:Hypp6360 [Branchiostoma lanceolatum]|uniref:Hypp6360 protein n=1 Tax=Branchiostoma lanceolatum TaxID=7740 RepID=A0A8K0E8U0_BRALA|nr:Hypp6360 [Branchiostoma lanceolatum]
MASRIPRLPIGRFRKRPKLPRLALDDVENPHANQLPDGTSAPTVQFLPIPHAVSQRSDDEHTTKAESANDVKVQVQRSEPPIEYYAVDYQNPTTGTTSAHENVPPNVLNRRTVHGHQNTEPSLSGFPCGGSEIEIKSRCLPVQQSQLEQAVVAITQEDDAVTPTNIPQWPSGQRRRPGDDKERWHPRSCLDEDISHLYSSSDEDDDDTTPGTSLTASITDFGATIADGIYQQNFYSEGKNSFPKRGGVSADYVNSSVFPDHEDDIAAPEIVPTGLNSSDTTLTAPVHTYQNAPEIPITAFNGSDTTIPVHFYQNTGVEPGSLWQKKERRNVSFFLDERDIFDHAEANMQEDGVTASDAPLAAIGGDPTHTMNSRLPCLRDNHTHTDRLHGHIGMDSVSFDEDSGPRAMMEDLRDTDVLTPSQMSNSMYPSMDSDGDNEETVSHTELEMDFVERGSTSMNTILSAAISRLWSGHQKRRTRLRCAPNTRRPNEDGPTSDSTTGIYRKGGRAMPEAAPLATLGNTILQPVNRAPACLQPNHMYTSAPSVLTPDDSERTSPRQLAVAVEEATTITSAN